MQPKRKQLASTGRIVFTGFFGSWYSEFYSILHIIHAQGSTVYFIVFICSNTSVRCQRYRRNRGPICDIEESVKCRSHTSELILIYSASRGTEYAGKLVNMRSFQCRAPVEERGNHEYATLFSGRWILDDRMTWDTCCKGAFGSSNLSQ